MEIKKIVEEIKLDKSKDTLLVLTQSILKIEETLIESFSDTDKIKENVKNLLYNCFYYVKENKIEINNPEVNDLDLDYWKNNITFFKSKNPNMSTDIYLYSIRNSLMFLLDIKKDKVFQKAYCLELIIKSFLFIDFMNLSIDSILGEI